MYLFFDTETNGLPKDFKAPMSDLNNWPRLVQIAWLQYDNYGKQISSCSHIIKPQGFIIPPDAIKVHGISNEKAEKEGLALKKVLNEFLLVINESKFLIAHNVDFDQKVIGAEFLRENIKTNLSKIEKICTMQSSTNYCQIPSSYGYKWPSLSEIHMKLFNSSFKESHDALVDVTACAKCFFELKKLGVIK